MAIADDATKNHVVTRLLRNWRDGDLSAYEELVPMVYDELHLIAARQMRKSVEPYPATLGSRE
jgi:hypothetical protein